MKRLDLLASQVPNELPKTKYVLSNILNKTTEYILTDIADIQSKSHHHKICLYADDILLYITNPSSSLLSGFALWLTQEGLRVFKQMGF